jgi:hypothetical protein
MYGLESAVALHLVLSLSQKGLCWLCEGYVHIMLYMCAGCREAKPWCMSDLVYGACYAVLDLGRSGLWLTWVLVATI